MNTVDKEIIREARWCPHVVAQGIVWKRNEKSYLVVKTQPVTIVIEDGLVKILCQDCFYIAINPKLPFS